MKPYQDFGDRSVTRHDTPAISACGSSMIFSDAVGKGARAPASDPTAKAATIKAPPMTAL